MLQRQPRDDLGEFLKIRVAADEIGFRIHFDERTRSIGYHDTDQAFRSDPARLLGRGRQTFLPKPIDGGLDVAATLRQGALAIHHADARLIAQLLHASCSDLNHCFQLR